MYSNKKSYKNSNKFSILNLPKPEVKKTSKISDVNFFLYFNLKIIIKDSN